MKDLPEGQGCHAVIRQRGQSGKKARFGKVLMGAQEKLGQVNVAEGKKGWCQLSSRHGLKVRFVQNLGRGDAAQERAQEK